MLERLRANWQNRIGQTKTVLGEKVREALSSVLPITLIVLFLCFTAAPVPTPALHPHSSKSRHKHSANRRFMQIPLPPAAAESAKPVWLRRFRADLNSIS